MLRNYLNVAIRNLLKHKWQSTINISGLAIGMACCILILLFIRDEFSFDRYHEKGEKIVRVLVERLSDGQSRTTPSIPIPLAQALTGEFSEIEHAVRFFNPDNPIPLVEAGDKRFYESRFFFVDANVFDVFTFPLIQGDPKTALQEPFSIVIPERVAQKYFGDENPMGRTITFMNRLDFKVTGVLRNIPRNSHLRPDYFASFATVRHWLGNSFVNN